MIGMLAETGDELICPVSGRLVRLTVVVKDQDPPPELRVIQQQLEYLKKWVTFALKILFTRSKILLQERNKLCVNIDRVQQKGNRPMQFLVVSRKGT